MRFILSRTVDPIVILAVLFGLGASTAAARPLLRFPDVAGDTVVFTYAEDIWSASTTGGIARRLTDDEGEERHSKLSPDGSLIAFTGEINGNPDVHVMTVDGGGLRRLTYHPAADGVVGWYPTSGKILFRSSRSSYSRFDRLFLVAPEGGAVEELALHEAARGSFSPDGQWVVENRGVTPDMIVELDPAEMARGWDAQLQKGIEVLLETIDREPIVPPEHPSFPVLD